MRVFTLVYIVPYMFACAAVLGFYCTLHTHPSRDE